MSNTNGNQIPATSGFSNTSAQSGFGMLAAPKPVEKTPLPETTSSSAFASSGFASLAGSSSSGFGSLGAGASSSPFGTMGNHNATSSFGSFGSFGQPATTEVSAAVTEQAKPPVPASSFASLTSSASPFASVPGTSVFGGAPAAFDGAAYGGGFRGSFVSAPSSKPLSSFASASTAPSTFGSKPAKAFGAAEDEEDGADADEDPEAGPAFAEDTEHKDDRFYEQSRMFIISCFRNYRIANCQTVETGEESETTEYRTRVKLYMTVDKQWKERGVGELKINVRSGDDEKVTARFLMRADGVHRIVLNSPLTKQVEVKDPAGGPPKGKHAIFLGFVEGEPTLMQVKVSSDLLAVSG